MPVFERRNVLPDVSSEQALSNTEKGQAKMTFIHLRPFCQSSWKPLVAENPNSYMSEIPVMLMHAFNLNESFEKEKKVIAC